MFFNIFKNEISYWLDRPAFYVYSLIFLFIAVMTSGSAAGLFDSVTVTVGSSRIVNSPFALSGLFAGLSSLVIFLYFMISKIQRFEKKCVLIKMLINNKKYL